MRKILIFIITLLVVSLITGCGKEEAAPVGEVPAAEEVAPIKEAVGETAPAPTPTLTAVEWEQVATNDEVGEIHDLRAFENHLYAATTEGIFRSSDGTTWEQVATWSDVGYTESLGNFGGYLYVGNSAPSRSANGIEWERSLTLGRPASGATAFGTLGTYFYKGSGWGIDRSSDGIHWEQVATADDVGVTHKGVYAFGNLGNYLYSGGQVIYRSSNGTTWERVGAVKGESLWIKGGIYAFGNLGNYLYAGSYVNGIYRTSDGTTWENVGPAWVKAFENIGSYLYAGGSGVFRTSDGTTWELLTSRGELGRIATLGNLGNNLYAGGDKGIFRTK